MAKDKRNITVVARLDADEVWGAVDEQGRKYIVLGAVCSKGAMNIVAEIVGRDIATEIKMEAE